MASDTESPSNSALRPWLVRIPEVFEQVASDVLDQLGAETTTRLGQEYYLIKVASPKSVHHSPATKFTRWNLPMDHTWPCNPRKMDQFIEKAAQTLAGKFADRKPQGLFVGQLNPGSPDKYFKTLASNLRGRTLQLFPGLTAATVEEQHPTKETLFCLLGKEGLFCGMQSPRRSNGLYAGGSKYIDKDGPDSISRAGAKIAEALHYLLLYRPPLPAGSHWLELGACPGGMTGELLAREQKVTAIDRAPLDKRLDKKPGLKFLQSDVVTFNPRKGETYDALLCDMNCPPEESIYHVIRLSRYLKKRGLVVFTLKLPKVETVHQPCALFDQIVETTTGKGLQLFAQTHLTNNRHEFTLFFERK